MPTGESSGSTHGDDRELPTRSDRAFRAAVTDSEFTRLRESEFVDVTDYSGMAPGGDFDIYVAVTIREQDRNLSETVEEWSCDVCGEQKATCTKDGVDLCNECAFPEVRA